MTDTDYSKLSDAELRERLLFDPTADLVGCTFRYEADGTEYVQVPGSAEWRLIVEPRVTRPAVQFVSVTELSVLASMLRVLTADTPPTPRSWISYYWPFVLLLAVVLTLLVIQGVSAVL